MKRSDYMRRAEESLSAGKITEEVYDAMIQNADIFCDDDDEDEDPEYSNLPAWYAEIEYPDIDSPEAIAGTRWDDMNYQHYMER